MDRLSATPEIENLYHNITICLDGIFNKNEITAIVITPTGYRNLLSLKRNVGWKTENKGQSNQNIPVGRRDKAAKPELHSALPEQSANTDKNRIQEKVTAEAVLKDKKAPAEPFKRETDQHVPEGWKPNKTALKPDSADKEMEATQANLEGWTTLQVNSVLQARAAVHYPNLLRLLISY